MGDGSARRSVPSGPRRAPPRPWRADPEARRAQPYGEITAMAVGTTAESLVGPIPSGFCQCGCGQPTAIATTTKTAFGHVKGKPVRFIRGHRGRLNRVPRGIEDEVVAMVQAGG